MRTLRNYQQEAIDFLLARGSGLLALDTGLGKTGTAFSLINKLNAREKILYVCPASLKFEVEKEAKLWIPNVPINVIHGTPAKRRKQWANREGVTICNYELLLKDVNIMPLDWEIIIADEAHRLGSFKSKTTKLFHKHLKAKWRIPMTATPTLTRPDQIWGLVTWLKPDHLNNWWSFRARYAILNNFNAIVGYRGLDELNSRIKDLIFRRNKRDVEKSLPPLTVIDVPVELNDNERRLYNVVKSELLYELQDKDLSIPLNSLGSSVVNMTRLRQICGSLELVSETHKDSSKIEALKEKLEEIMDGTDEKVVIYSQFAKLLDVVARELGHLNPLVIQGSVDAKERSAAMELFNNDPARRVILISTAGGQGLNLQTANNLIMLDQNFSHGQNLQVIGRIERIGQTRPMFVYRLVAQKTIDGYILKKLNQRIKQNDELFGDDEAKMTVRDVIEAIQ